MVDFNALHSNDFDSVVYLSLIHILRDGMNLVAKEYVAVKQDYPGVLVLSEMAGAAVDVYKRQILVLWIFAQFAGPNSGNAEVVELNGKVVGAANVGQSIRLVSVSYTHLICGK